MRTHALKTHHQYLTLEKIPDDETPDTLTFYTANRQMWTK